MELYYDNLYGTVNLPFLGYFPASMRTSYRCYLPAKDYAKMTKKKVQLRIMRPTRGLLLNFKKKIDK